MAAAPYPGPWRVLAATSLAEHPRLRPGEIMLHGAATTLLCCPWCGTFQFTLIRPTGPAEAPSLPAPVRCAAATCRARRCPGYWTIQAGATVPLPPP